ncbi:hypothetical protein PO909_013717 [Leuciscus waleckii]
MMPNKGYCEAKRLLHKHYGDELRIASAYIDKALKWPQVKSDDGKALSAYAMFLIGCRNTMEDIEFLEKMDNPTNLRTVVSKLPYKLKERWRAEAYDIKERRGRRARFADLVSYIDRQARIAMDPLFGNISDSRPISSGKIDQKEKHHESKGPQETHVKPTNSIKTVSAFEKPCLYYQQSHTLASCSKIKHQPHKERVDFLKLKGLCFGCLVPGNLSKFCKRRIECKECALKHPDILHIIKEEGSVSPEKKDGRHGSEVSCAQVSILQESCSLTGAGEAECVLSIVPVKIKSKRSDKCVETYAFLDPGSTATFCTEDLQRKLNIKGKPTRILLSTMGQDKHGEHNIPVHVKKIPKRSDIQKWPYLNEVRLPEIEADVGLLIGANCSRAMEPWHVINAEDGGPYAVKTAIGWVMNGPVRKELNDAMNKTPTFSVNRISVMEIEKLLVQQYNTDFPERNYDDREEMSCEDKQFLQSVQGTTIFENRHYSIGLPLRNEKLQMPNNRCVAEQRIDSLLRKFKKNPEFFEEYKSFMETIIERGYAVQVPFHQLNRDDNRLFYIPHHGVYHPKKQKLRVVFDCTASFQGRSLNSELLQGPDLTNTLVGVLLRFREEPVAIMADIESMFYQVKEDAVTLAKDLRTLCASGGFTLTKWMSNSRKVLMTIPEVHRASEVKDLDLRHDALPVERTLGVQWDTETDTFTYSMKLQDKPMTRRGILSVVNSIYDPLGFLATVILPAKLLLKDLCKEQYGWDENIGGKHAEVWKRWIEDVSHLSTFHVSRCLKPTDFGCTTAAQLHHFSDASESAYGTVSYLLLENSEGERHCAFLMGKARVAPLKLVTIPRLELTAAVLRYIDSETARFKTFVANRISLIREATKPSQWKYVRTTENPADQASRGLKAKSLTQGGTWINGPEFLLNNECDWSEQPVRRKESLQNDPEVKNGATINIIKVEENMEPIDKLISYYSDWHKLKRSVAWILKVKENLWKLKEERKEVSRKLRETEKDPEKVRSKLEQQMKKFKAKEKKSLTLDDLVVAESEIIKFSQRQ